MKEVLKVAIVACAIGTVGGMTHAHSFDLVDNEIGDSSLVTLGGYTMARPKSIDLPVVCGVGSNETQEICSVSCQIVYKDRGIQYPPSEEDWEQMQFTGKLLNDWLESYVRSECADIGFDDLCANYSNGDFVKGLQDGFPEYVRMRILQMDPAVRIFVEAVTVTVRAEGAFRRELLRRLDDRE